MGENHSKHGALCIAHDFNNLLTVIMSYSELGRFTLSPEQRIDLFLSDVVMPGESGPSVIERLSADRPAAKVLFVSGYPGADISRRGIDEASFRFLAKPYSSEQLAQRVRQVLDD
ncbi:MAG TPA: response regulator [Polyangiaceae bacterium]|jgi:DNA-binding NtrC family response regulator|nr:response regulator [Polyangiaceae bacterium]